MAAKQSRTRSGPGYIFLVYQSTRLDCKDSQPSSSMPAPSGYFKVTKNYGDDKKRAEKIKNLKK